MKRRLAVVCDFDGTAILEDVADALSIAFGGYENWKATNDAFHAGRIEFEELLRRIFEPITATAAEVHAFALERAHFRPGFEELLATCRRRDIRFVLASGGLDLYIHPALTKLPRELTDGPGYDYQPDWSPDGRYVVYSSYRNDQIELGLLDLTTGQTTTLLGDGLELRANHAEYVPGGLALSFPHAHAPGACGRCGSCKGAIVKELQRQGMTVLAVGDGNADRCMARVADHLFARGRLLDWCRAEAVACEPFETFQPVLARLEVLAVGR